MAKRIHVSRVHNTDRETALGRLQVLIRQLDEKYGMTITLRDDGATVGGHGVIGAVVIDGERVTLDLDLGLPASLVAERIEASINRYMDKHFG